ncbi:MAG TPA: hypothetical protein VF364_02585 [Candidatus Limnocylindria bacterium]
MTIRRPILLGLAILLVVLVAAPIALLWLQGARAPAGGGAGEPSPSEVGPTDDAAAGPLEPGDIAWVFAPWIFAQGPGNHYVLQAGTLADPAPLVDMEVPWAGDPETQVGRVPAVGRAIEGTVVYVADDGAGTAIHRLQIRADGGDEVLAEMREIVWSMAVAPDGQHAYLALVARDDDEHDLGVVRLALDGSGELREVMPPSRPRASEPAGMRLAAIARFGVDLMMSAEGGHLLRRTCGAGACTIDVLELETGEVIDLGQREVMGAAGGVILGSRCTGVRCFAEAINLATGVAQELPFQGEAGITFFDGRAAIVYIEFGPDGGSVLRTLDPFDGETRDVLHVDEGGALMLSPPQGDLRISMPAGYVHAAFTTDIEKGGAAIPFTDVAVPLGGGAVIELPAPPIRHPDGLGVQG